VVEFQDDAGAELILQRSRLEWRRVRRKISCLVDSDVTFVRPFSMDSLAAMARFGSTVFPTGKLPHFN
jgi:hypothetical protein